MKDRNRRIIMVELVAPKGFYRVVTTTLSTEADSLTGDYQLLSDASTVANMKRSMGSFKSIVYDDKGTCVGVGRNL